jgi:hypothetical protein
LQTTVHGDTQPRFHLQLGKNITAERREFENQDYWSVRKDGNTEVCVATGGCIAACLDSGPKNPHSDVVSCIFVCKTHVG